MASKKRHRSHANAQAPRVGWTGDAAETHAFVYTFTFRIPFRLGISDNFDQEIAWPSGYARSDDADTFAKPPFVRLRLFNAPVPDRKFSPANGPAAVRRFYSTDYDVVPSDEADPPLYEQWVSLETPAAVLERENPADGAYAFHRSLSALNIYLQAFALARNDDAVRPISARELRPVVIIGALELDGNWKPWSEMLMHPDAKARPLGRRPLAQHAAGLNKAIETILIGNPFVRSWQWKSRAERRRYEGDNADAVVSFQIAAEVLLFELWALLLADEGRPAAEILELRDSTSFSSLVRTELSQRLGGTWDTTRPKAAVGRYWNDVYELRVKVVHAGYLPHDGDAESAERAFQGLEKFLEERVQTRAKRYPSAVRAMQQLADALGPSYQARDPSAND